MKSGNLNFQEHSGSLQACKGTALHFLPFTLRTKTVNLKDVTTIIVNDYTEFILRAQEFGFRFLYLKEYFALAQNILKASMLHSAPYSDGTASPFPIVHWQVREADHSLPPNSHIIYLWSWTPKQSNQNILSTHWFESVISLFIRLILFNSPWNFILVTHLNNKISNSHRKLSCHSRIRAKKWHGIFLCNLNPQGMILIC